MNDLVSVIIPVYNVEKYVKEAIQSIQNQTYKNLEIIIIDDGSTDDTYSIIKELARSDDRIKFYKNEKNLKIVKTLNRALSLATGSYIVRMDGDDVSKLDRIERKVNFLEQNPDIDLVGCSLISIDENGREIKKIKKLQSFDLIKKTLRYTSPVSHIWMCKKDVYSRLNGYRELSGAEDYDFVLRLISSGMKAINIADYYGYYVRIAREGNTISSTGLLQKKLHEKIYSMYKKRIKYGMDDFEKLSLGKPLDISNVAYIYAVKKFNEARISRVNKNYFMMILKLVLSMISPHQVHAYYLRLMYKIKVRNDL